MSNIFTECAILVLKTDRKIKYIFMFQQLTQHTRVNMPMGFHTPNLLPVQLPDGIRPKLLISWDCFWSYMI